MVITDLGAFVSGNIWLHALRKESFGIILPGGWLGRPYDNQHRIKEISVSKNVLTIVFDDIRELQIVNPKRYEIKKLDPNWSSLKFLECQEIRFLWVPYGEESTGKTTVRTFNQEGNTLELVGYFPLVP